MESLSLTQNGAVVLKCLLLRAPLLRPVTSSPDEGENNAVHYAGGDLSLLKDFRIGWQTLWKACRNVSSPVLIASDGKDPIDCYRRRLGPVSRIQLAIDP